MMLYFGTYFRLAGFANAMPSSICATKSSGAFINLFIGGSPFGPLSLSAALLLLSVAFKYQLLCLRQRIPSESRLLETSWPRQRSLGQEYQPCLPPLKTDDLSLPTTTGCPRRQP